MKALAVHRFCGNAVRIIVEVLEPDTQASAVWDETEKGGIEVICPIKLHYKMIARRLISSVLLFFLSISSQLVYACTPVILANL